MPINVLSLTSFPRLLFVMSVVSLGLTACSGDKKKDTLTLPNQRLVGVDRSATGGDDNLQGGVNAYLWRAAVDTLAFMPFLSADAVGGTLVTDWYQPVASNPERFQIVCAVLDRRLRSDSITVVVHRQVQENGQWVDAPVTASTASDITSKIQVRARQLRADKH
ncbi:DUF3576 domain-containing protein [Commensalibacter oyaizuii]|uniref:DUF3576 domain-containing protein n=1 Tax=Commensalibacter oyaizuii TaxID=3043873 RepID=A0ABT6Q365_9PROT|nr:DUF3576 domain-containing protein [Commensalibacter sp. TBRC 16381]MDI2091545.1 DUF3576 domain-containing protein [Commensalibacter sp. TBRC 16381]